jgi:hypothetical protein
LAEIVAPNTQSHNARNRGNLIKMANSKQLAGLIGPTLVVIAISKALNFRFWVTSVAPVTYLVGVLLFVAGLSIVRVHNLWVRGWPVLITLLGWVIIFGGLFRMFAPEAQQTLQNTPFFGVYIIDIVALAIGLYLTFEAYWMRN